VKTKWHGPYTNADVIAYVSMLQAAFINIDNYRL